MKPFIALELEAANATDATLRVRDMFRAGTLQPKQYIHLVRRERTGERVTWGALEIANTDDRLIVVFPVSEMGIRGDQKRVACMGVRAVAAGGMKTFESHIRTAVTRAARLWREEHKVAA